MALPRPHFPGPVDAMEAEEAASGFWSDGGGEIPTTIPSTAYWDGFSCPQPAAGRYEPMNQQSTTLQPVHGMTSPRLTIFWLTIR